MNDERPPARSPRDQQWLLTLLPAFPVLLLVMRLWFLSRQNLQTMLLLVENVSPLGMLSALTITLVWAAPVPIITIAVFGTLLRASVSEPRPSRLARVTARMPGWVVILAVMVAALTWQLRFLPTLTMLTVCVAALWRPERGATTAGGLPLYTVVLPAAAALVMYALLGPAIVAALRTSEWVTFLLLLLPPALTVLLPGPVPERFAAKVTEWPAAVGALLAPFLLGTLFIRTPILPTTALEVAPPSGSAPVTVLRGLIVSVDDRMTAVLDRDGNVTFVPNERLISKVLCPDVEQAPNGNVRVHGWNAEEPALQWIAPQRRPTTPDPRCEGRRR